jgi:hypothetical protein
MDTEGSFPRVKAPELEAGHSRPTSADVKKTFTFTPPPPRLDGMVLS